MEQGTTEWLKSRLGKFNGSEVGDLMGTPKTKGKQWTDTALKLIYKVAAERHLSFLLMYDDNLLEEFLARSGVQTVAMKWGHEHEKDAVNELAAQLTREGVKGFQLRKEASVIHPTVLSRLEARTTSSRLNARTIPRTLSSRRRRSTTGRA